MYTLYINKGVSKIASSLKVVSSIFDLIERLFIPHLEGSLFLTVWCAVSSKYKMNYPSQLPKSFKITAGISACTKTSQNLSKQSKHYHYLRIRINFNISSNVFVLQLGINISKEHITGKWGNILQKCK